MSTSPTTTAATTTWNIDPAHSSAEFKVKHMMISNVKGHFGKVPHAHLQIHWHQPCPGR
jgi:polyisoprenoid-binding protein YceI